MKRLSFIICSLFFSVALWAQEKPMKAYMVANAHLDTQWNWDVQATIRDHIRNTLTQNLFLLKQYPDYIFNFEGAVKYSWMKEYYPELYNEMKQYVDNGRWQITGSGWDANEVIIGSPESWIRNILLGQTFYRKEFNREGTDVFLPDCFGFPYTLPSLAAHCGLIGFSSQKLGWRAKPFYEGNKRYPFTIGLWEGIDGSRIMMAHGFGYAERWKDEDLSKNTQLIREIGESPLNQVYRYYGTGDIGGSPTVSSVRAVEKGIKGDGPVQIVSATSDQLYKDYLPYDQHPELPVFDGELTMDLHGNGCYTSQAAMKLYNRQNEHLGDAAERASVMADWLGTAAYPRQQLTEAWQRIIWHQFHDDLTGTSIPRAYEFSWNDELLSLKQFSDVLTHSVGAITRKMDTNVSGLPVVVYNNEAFPVTSIVKLQLDNATNYNVSDASGKPVKSQLTADGHLLFEASVPSTGMAVYSLKPGGKNVTVSLPRWEGQLENSVYRLRVDANGDIESLYDKQAQRELVAEGRRIRLVVFNDCRSESWPAWEIQKRTLDKEPVGIHDNVSISMTENGPLRKTLTITKRYGTSDIRQQIHLYEGSEADRIDFENTVDWKAENALLKAEFPMTISNEKASYDLGLGMVERSNNRDNQFEVYSHEWTDLTDRSGSYGMTILNDSRYGWDKPADNTLRLSLLYAPKPGRAYAYQAHQDKGRHVFTYSLIGHQGALYLAETTQRATVLNSPLRAFQTPKHKGELGRTVSFVSSDNSNVLIRALKQAEASDEYVVRVYELGGKSAQKAHLTFAADIVKAVEADGTEKTLRPASFSGRHLQVSIKPFSVKTYKLKLNTSHLSPLTTHLSPLTTPLSLPFNRQCATFNAFRSEADFEGGFSYAAELLPEDGKLEVDGITFQLGESDDLNGLSCKGDTLQLPSVATRLYLLAASNQGDRDAAFAILNGKSRVVSRPTLEVPFYSGFVGQWGHDGQTRGHLKQAQVAYVGTHRHSPTLDEPYEYTYMYKLHLDIPKDATQLVLPNDPHIVIFAATLANDDAPALPLTKLFETSNRDDYSYRSAGDDDAMPTTPNLLKGAKILSWSGYVNDRERPEFLTDGNPKTKWCDTNPAPNYVTFDLGAVQKVSRWRLLNAGAEMSSYITRTCLLQTRCNETEEWTTVDMFDQNRNNVTDRHFTPTDARFVRLFVVGSTQTTGDATRIYEFELFAYGL